mmetsp:Transcript_13202/g.17959  ORF Transcript_13202/g.17959 Transcript_13202/m.17959 type:complete len:83 (+) Transcript_13202:3142-3390(+)
MAYLLKRSLFCQSKNKKEIKVALSHIELKAQAAIWHPESAIFKGTLIAGVFLEQLLSHCRQLAVHLLPSQKAKLLEQGGLID